MAGAFTVSIAGHRLTVSGDDDGVAAVEPGFSGVADRSGGAAHASLEITTSDDPAGRPPWRDCANGVHHYRGGALSVVLHRPSSVETFLPGARPRLHLTASPAALASGDLRSQPANHAIASWLAGPTVQLVHAGAVALDGRGVLLVGIGGRGKSTTALACAQAGFSFLGDDLCIVESGRPDRGFPARVHGIYATAKLNRDSRERLSDEDWQVLGVTLQGKDAVSLPAGIRFDREAPLAAIVVVRADGHSAGTARRLSPGEAIRLLVATGGPSVVSSATPGLWLGVAAALARDVPTYELGLTWDLDRVVTGVRTIVERESGES